MNEVTFHLRRLIKRFTGNGPCVVRSFASIFTNDPNPINRKRRPAQKLRSEQGDLFNLARHVWPEGKSRVLADTFQESGWSRAPNRELFVVDDAIILGNNGVVYDPLSRAAIQETVQSWSSPSDRHWLLAARLPGIRKLPGVTLVLGNLFPSNFYHLLYDCIVRLALAGPILGSIDRIAVGGKGGSWAEAWLRRAGWAGEIVWLETFSHLRCERVYFTSPLLNIFEPSPWVITQLRKLCGATLPAAKAQRVLFASRDDASSRVSPVEQRLVEILRDTEIICFSKFTPAATVALMGETRVLIGWHGAALANSVFLPPDSVVIELVDTDVPAVFPRVAHAAGLTYHAIDARDRTEFELDKMIHSLAFALSS